MAFWLLVAVAALAVIAGATASVVGFGIGSLLTPLVAAKYGIDVAVAVVVVPHLIAGLLRGFILRRSIDWRVVLRFGLLSTAGGLVGALVFARLAPAALTRVLGALLLATAIAGITGWTQRWTPKGPTVWALGGLSGFFGGVVGNQGGLRAAALSAFGLTQAAFVGTSTVVGVMIDIVRLPVYVSRSAAHLSPLWPLIAVAVAGVVAGTLVGDRILLGLSKETYRRIVGIAVGLLGLWFLLGPA